MGVKTRQKEICVMSWHNNGRKIIERLMLKRGIRIHSQRWFQPSYYYFPPRWVKNAISICLVLHRQRTGSNKSIARCTNNVIYYSLPFLFASIDNILHQLEWYQPWSPPAHSGSNTLQRSKKYVPPPPFFFPLLPSLILRSVILTSFTVMPSLKNFVCQWIYNNWRSNPLF